jgi:hypothetical protein
MSFYCGPSMRIISLPIKVGELGLYSAKRQLCMLLWRAQHWVLQNHILRNSGICCMDSDFDNDLDGLCDTVQTFDFNSFTIPID